MAKVLGIDMGTNSIGWCLIEEYEDKDSQIIDLGVRIFQRVLEDKQPIPKNRKRREKRLARRVLDRRARRKSRLRNYLIKIELLPESLKTESPEGILNTIGRPISKTFRIGEEQVFRNCFTDPYDLRRIGLEEPLTPYEFGRVLLHLCARRGFQSNRKTLLGNLAEDPDVLEALAEIEAQSGDEAEALLIKDKEKIEEAKKMKAEIEKLKDLMGTQTLGQYLAGLNPHERKRDHHRTDRSMYRDELKRLWEKQSSFDPDRFTSEVYREIEHIIFYQRPIRFMKNRVGKCLLEPTRPRAKRARLESQRFRYWQDLNNLQLEHATGETSVLTLEQKQMIAQALERQESMTWGGLRKKLGLKQVKFNLEKSGTKMLFGNRTVCAIRKCIGIHWDNFSPENQIQLVEDISTIDNKKALKKRLQEHWNFSLPEIIRLVTVQFEPGYMNQSLKAIRALLPHLQKGLIYSDARVAAGYGYDTAKTETIADRLGPHPDVPNPVVSKALGQTRRLVNAVIAAYGKPDELRIELARELKMNAKEKERLEKQQKENADANKMAEEQYQSIRQNNLHLNLSPYPSRDDKIKYRLWKECKGICIYSGNGISLTQLFSPEVEIDHILPFSRTFDDSFMNKVVVFSDQNRAKENKTPYEYFSAAHYDEILQRASALPFAKRQRLMNRELKQPEEFISNQLNDTRYMSTLAQQYVKQLGVKISVNKGGITAMLRSRWGLNEILGTPDKNRSDHRHHAIDAAVIAVTGRRMYQRIATHLQQPENQRFGRPIRIPAPRDDFFVQLKQRVDNVLVSHEVCRKVSGALHEETAYGLRPGENGEMRIVHKKKLDSGFNAKQIEKIYDPGLKEIIRAHFKKHGANSKEAFSDKNPVFHKDGRTRIRHVLVDESKFNPDSYAMINNREGEIYKYYPLGNNHHVEIFKTEKKGKTQYKGRFVTMMGASKRKKQPKTPVVDRICGDGQTFVMSLCINDVVSIDNNGKTIFYRVQYLDPDGDRLKLRLHTASTIDIPEEAIRKSINVLVQEYGMKKVNVNVIGKVIGND
jgi:CRISPR-associated endonuclease Csn1